MMQMNITIGNIYKPVYVYMKRRMTMPKYEVVRSYLVSQVAVIEAESADQARIISMNWDGYWKEYDGEYDDEITVYEVGR